MIKCYDGMENRHLLTPCVCIVNSGVEYESALCKVIQSLGFSCNVTPASGDQGVDLVVNVADVKIAVQCKLYSENLVGNDAVQQVYAGAAFWGCSLACVVSNAKFSQGAKALSEVTGVRLLHHDDLASYLLGIMHEKMASCANEICDRLMQIPVVKSAVAHDGSRYYDIKVETRNKIVGVRIAKYGRSIMSAVEDVILGDRVSEFDASIVMSDSCSDEDRCRASEFGVRVITCGEIEEAIVAIDAYSEEVLSLFRENCRSDSHCDMEIIMNNLEQYISEFSLSERLAAKLRKACNGHSKAQYQLGMEFLKGDECVKDTVEGAWWLAKASELGYNPKSEA